MVNHPHLDRWHYLDYQDGKHDKNYIEWKYFNFIQKDLAGYLVYYILDPELKTKLGGGRVLARIFKNGESFGSLERIGVNQIQFDPVSAEAIMGGNKITEINSYQYIIEGKIGGVFWKLGYKQKAPTIQSFVNINPGFMRWEKENWLIKMPKAEVSGEIRAGKNIFQVNGLGYSDTNWGKIMPLFAKYKWGQFNGGGISFAFGVLYGFKNISKTYFYLVNEKSVTSLDDAKCDIKHTGWIIDKNSGFKIPGESKFVFQNRNYKVQISSALINYDLLGLKISSVLPKLCVCEMLVNYSGEIEKNGQRIYEFNGRGFQEWSVRTWRKIPLLF